MHSRTIVLAIGLLAAPLSLLAAPGTPSASPNAFWPVSATGDVTVDGRRFEAAPVPSVGPAGIAPVDRVAGSGSRTLDAGPYNSTPFSNTPSGTLSSGGSQDLTFAWSDSQRSTPNLGR